MKTREILSTLLLTATVCLAHAQQNEWEDPTRYEWNKEQPHADFRLYDRAEDAVPTNRGLRPGSSRSTARGSLPTPPPSRQA